MLDVLVLTLTLTGTMAGMWILIDIVFKWDDTIQRFLLGLLTIAFTFLWLFGGFYVHGLIIQY